MSSVLDDIIESLRRVAQSNAKFQQEILASWVRLWPAVSSRQAGGWDTPIWLRPLAALGVAGSGGELVAAVEHPLRSDDREGSGMPLETSTRPETVPATEVALPPSFSRNVYQTTAVVTGAASGIGEAVARDLAYRGARTVLLVDRDERVHKVVASINNTLGRTVAVPKVGDTTDDAFRKAIFSESVNEYGLVTICVPAAGITRDALSVRIDKTTGKSITYPVETFRQVTEINLLAPIYWGIEMVAHIAEDRWRRGLKRWEPEEPIQGVIVFLGSVSSQGNKGQIAYATAKAGLEGAAATLQKEAIYYGVRCGVIHPGFTDTPMVRALGDDFLQQNILPYTQLRRLIRPEEIADAICFMISNSAVSGELWADAGWHPPA
jgi:NAD(P)-dependent dehydrogenase (short-subunit alcohol dehydrogenase family)